MKKMKKVLIIEDDPMVVMINSEYISRFKDFKVIGNTSTLNETMEFLEHNNVDLILLDKYLKLENGLNILQNIRGIGFTVDIIMITASNDGEDIKKALSLGCIDYLIKPFDFERFKKSIEKFMIRNTILKNKILNQTTLDNLNNDSIKIKNSDFLPKGLNELSLKKIVEIILNNKEETFSIKYISENTKLSNVSVKKYLDYLESEGVIFSKVIYGKIGRPMYKYIKSNKIETFK